MKIPLRIKQEKELYPSFKQFSFGKGLQTLWFNLKSLFTKKLMVGESAWYEVTEKTDIISDFSLIFKEGEAKFEKTPEGTHEVALEITQTLDK